MVYHRHIKGAVLIPVLLLASIMALGIIVLLQSQLTQKKSIADFKAYLQNKRQEENHQGYLSSLPVEALFASKNLMFKQSIPQNLHYQNNDNHYYFQVDHNQYIYKLDSQPENIFIPVQAFDYAGTILEIVQIKKEEGTLFCLYDKNLAKMVFQTNFNKVPVFQLVGNPVNSIYLHDGKKLYKIELNFIESTSLKILKNIDIEEQKSENLSALLVTRDARGDGRLIYLSQNKHQSILLFHEASAINHLDDYLNLFEHY